MATTTKGRDNIGLGAVFLVWRSKLRRKRGAGQKVGRGTCRSTEVYKSIRGIQGYAGVYIGIQRYTRVCKGIQGYTGLYIGTQGYSKIGRASCRERV